MNSARRLFSAQLRSMHVPHLPNALHSGVLHDAAWCEAKGVSQGVRRRDGRSPLILLWLGVLSSHPLPAETLNTRLHLTKTYRKCESRLYYVYWCDFYFLNFFSSVRLCECARATFKRSRGVLEKDE